MRNYFGILALFIIVFVLAVASCTASRKKDENSFLTARRICVTAEENTEENIFYLFERSAF